MTKKYAICNSPIGNLFIIKENEAITSICIGDNDFLSETTNETIVMDGNDPILLKSVQQLTEYFNGKRKEFELPLSINGTNFQKSVWSALCAIPFGETKSYLDIANQIGNPKAVRAVGQANRANKLPILIPCHRVIGKNKSLTGYAGSRTDIKEILLSIEGASFGASS